jgi:hypothetical protein
MKSFFIVEHELRQGSRTSQESNQRALRKKTVSRPFSLLEFRAVPAKKKRGFTRLIRRPFSRSQPPRSPSPLRGGFLLCFFSCVSRVLRSPAKSREVPRSTAKYREVPRSTAKYREVPRRTAKSREFSRPLRAANFLFLTRAATHATWQEKPNRMSARQFLLLFMLRQVLSLPFGSPTSLPARFLQVH